MTKLIGLVAIGLVTFVPSVQAKNIGTFGMTYRIVEQDALVEIEDRARQVDWSKVFDKRKIVNYQGPPDRIHLPRTKRNRSFQVDMSW